MAPNPTALRASSWARPLACLGLLPLLVAAAPEPAPTEESSAPSSAAAAPATAPAEPLPTLLVLQTRVADAVADKLDATALTNVAGAVVNDLDRYQVVSHDDLAAMLDTETRKQLTGCDDTSCMAEIGAALGASFLLYSQVGSVAETYVCSVSLIDSERAAAVGRHSLEVRDSRQVVDALRVATLRLFGQEAELPPPPSDPMDFSVLKWSTLGVGLLAAAAGASGTGLAVMFAGEADAAEDKADFDGARRSGEIANGVAVGGYVAGGVLLASSALLFVLDAVLGPETGEEEP